MNIKIKDPNDFTRIITIPNYFPAKIFSITDKNPTYDDNGDPNPFPLSPILEEDTLLNDVYKNQKSPRILPPVVLATYKEKGKTEFINDNHFEVTVSVWFSLDIDPKTEEEIYIECIRMKNDWDGTDFRPEFLIQVKYDRNPRQINSNTTELNPPNYKVYKVEFIMKFIVLPNFIQTYVWKDDPEGSRGTTTTVQSGTGG